MRTTCHHGRTSAQFRPRGAFADVGMEGSSQVKLLAENRRSPQEVHVGLQATRERPPMTYRTYTSLLATTCVRVASLTFEAFNRQRYTPEAPRGIHDRSNEPGPASSSITTSTN